MYRNSFKKQQRKLRFGTADFPKPHSEEESELKPTSGPLLPKAHILVTMPLEKGKEREGS